MTTILNPSANIVRAIFLKSHIKLLRAGMRNSQLSPTQLLAKVSAVTGITYKRATNAELDRAIADLQAVVDAGETPST